MHYIYSYNGMFTKNKWLRKTSEKLMNEIFSKPPKKNYATNKRDVYHIEDISSLDRLDLKDYGLENNKRSDKF